MIQTIKQKLYWYSIKAAIDVADHLFFYIAMLSLLFWLGEGAGEQSGWISCPTK